MVLILPLYCRFKGSIKEKVLPRCERKRTPSDSLISSLSSCFFLYCITYVFCFLFWVSLVLLLCFALLNMFLLFIFSFVYFVFYIKIKKKFWKIRKYKNSVYFVYIGTCVPWIAIETKLSKFCIFCSLDEHLYAQLSKWVLWLISIHN